MKLRLLERYLFNFGTCIIGLLYTVGSESIIITNILLDLVVQKIF